MPMSDGKIGRWGAVLREAFAVLAAILIAFALDAWWDERVERSDMHDALDAVRIELGDNLAAIDTALAYNARQAELVAEALDLGERTVLQLSGKELGRFWNLPNYQIVTLRLGATAAFIEGGHLRVLEDPALRGDLAGLPQVQEEIDEEATSVNDVTLQLNSALLLGTAFEEMRTPQDMLGPEGSRAILRAVATVPEVRRTLYARTFLLDAIYGAELSNLRDELAAVRARIENELSG